MLINEEKEDEDVILNLIDIKTSIRIKGLRRLNQYAGQVREKAKPRLSAGTLRNILIPLVLSYVAEYKKEGGGDV